MKTFVIGLTMFVLGYTYCHIQLTATYEKRGKCIDIIKDNVIYQYEICYENSILDELELKDVGYIGNKEKIFKVRRIK